MAFEHSLASRQTYGQHSLMRIMFEVKDAESFRRAGVYFPEGFRWVLRLLDDVLSQVDQ
jgi:hypothetical protein